MIKHRLEICHLDDNRYYVLDTRGNFICNVSINGLKNRVSISQRKKLNKITEIETAIILISEDIINASCEDIKVL